jgi:hypothetical protein
MSIQGHAVDLSSHSYSTPSVCASCMGPRTTEVEARVSTKSGNTRTTLTMTFPYCDPCAKRARGEKLRHVLIGVLVAIFGGLAGLLAWEVDIGVGASIRFALELPLAALLAWLVSLGLRPSMPAAPATARGEAVILRDTSGEVLCTNPQFAELLAQANGVTARPATHWLTVELWAPLLALLIGVLVLLSWVKAGAPERTAATNTPAVSQPAAAAKSPAKAPAPTATAKPKKR